MGQISTDINNGGILTLTQEKHNDDILLSSPADEHRITSSELVMLMKYYHNCKSGCEKSDYISRHGEI